LNKLKDQDFIALQIITYDSIFWVLDSR